MSINKFDTGIYMWNIIYIKALYVKVGLHHIIEATRQTNYNNHAVLFTIEI